MLTSVFEMFAKCFLMSRIKNKLKENLAKFMLEYFLTNDRIIAKRIPLFNNQHNDETDFCESYKSQVLDTNTPETTTSPFRTVVKLLTILILLGAIIGGGFYGYNYFMSTQKESSALPLPPMSIQVSEDDAEISLIDESDTEELNDTQNVAATPKSNSEESSEEIRLEVPSPTPEAKYLEELADLSKEIDKEKK